MRAYATNSAGTAYGNELMFTTLPNLPTITTDTATNIAQTTATSGGNVTGDGGGSVSARGVCWSTSSGPTLSDSHTVDGSGTGTFISNLSGLTPVTTYYVRAYATNSVGTAYGNEVVFTTLPAVLPTVTTNTVTNITHTTAISGGNVIQDGGASVTARGVCWSITTNPTLADNNTVDGSGIGTFISSLSGLTEITTYYVRAYATNSVGTAYGNEVVFITTPAMIPCPGFPTVSYGGKTYNTVLIGSQCWLKENLNFGMRIPGSQSQTDNWFVEKYCYNDLESNCQTYGGLYQWDEMMDYSTTAGTQGICPNGWHVPTDEEWKILEGTVDSQYPVGDPVWNSNGERGFDVGKNLKSTSGWSNSGNGLDLYGFKARPGGIKVYGWNFANVTYYAHFWTSTQTNGNWAYHRRLNYSTDKSQRDGSKDKVDALSVRCIKN